jgi:hypothetical protein
MSPINKSYIALILQKYRIFQLFANDTGEHLDNDDKNEVANNTAIFCKIRNGPNGVLRGPGETDSRKTAEVRDLVSGSL